MRHENDRLGLTTAAAVMLTAFLKWLSDLTAGESSGGRYDVAAVNWLAWFGCFVMGGVAATLLVTGAVRMVERARERRRATTSV